MQLTVEPSPALSRLRVCRRALAGLAVAAALIVVYQLAWRQHVKRFQTVRAGVLYRVAQPSEWGVRYLVHRHGVKTILNLRLEDDYLHRGVLGVGGPAGEVESRFVGELGICHRQWPMGHETCWPWLTPWQYEEFFRLFDDPDNCPVAVHCVSGRHRTGTIAALYRLEYDRWPPDRVLAEMYSFDFGLPIPLQEMNLRTYVPRPLPSAAEWAALRDAAAPLDAAAEHAPRDYADLMRQLRASADRAAVRKWLIGELEQGGTFSLPLAARLIDSSDDEACAAATRAADRCLHEAFAGQNEASGDARPASPADLLASAALVADFGNPEEQERLLALLRAAIARPAVTPAFRAVAAGVANRYTGNRIPFLALLLDDARPMPDTGRTPVRYCDMAVAHLSAILDERLINAGPYPTPHDWDQARANAKTWVAEHPQVARLSRLLPPSGHNVLR